MIPSLKKLLDLNVQSSMLGKTTTKGLRLTNANFEPFPYKILMMGKSKKA
jgi:hypothetical protein